MITSALQKNRPWFLLLGSLILMNLSACSPESTLSQEPEPTALRLQKITAGEQNFQQYHYSSAGLLVKFQSNWAYADSTVAILNAELEYDAENRLSRIISNGSLSVKFYYEGKLLDKTEEYDHRNRLVVSHFYLFGAEGRLVELLDQIHDTDNDTFETATFIKYRYEYDSRGNVTQTQSFIRKPGSASFKAWETVAYEGYDDRKNPHQPLVQYPYLPQERTMVNNPGKITVKRSEDQSVISVLTLTYQYNQQGYPTHKTQQMTTTKPFPASTVYYHYE
ncbi:hypothetical protein [Larkinella sp.]|uniref:hypothetical protein n=1 Tax=Larkinella sp. TaxID=2034517 RepID=UPI003BA8E990